MSGMLKEIAGEKSYSSAGCIKSIKTTILMENEKVDEYIRLLLQDNRIEETLRYEKSRVLEFEFMSAK